MLPESRTIAPDRTLLRVDLPAPLSPTRPRTSPARNVRFTRSRDLIAPKDLLMSSIRTRIDASLLSIGVSRPARRSPTALGQAFLFEKGAELVDVLLGDDGDGDVDAWVDLLALFELQ